jgi:lipopolysaccharide export system protein LptC
MEQVDAVTMMQHSDQHSYGSTGRDDDGRMFRAAVRHSRRVRIMRIAIPVVALLIVAAVVLLTWFNPLTKLFNLSKDIGRMVVTGTKITMESPRLTGFTRDSRSYELTARAAMQDITTPDLLELKDIHAVVEMQDKGLMDMTAANGTYDSKAETLDIPSKALLVASSGFECHLNEAKIDVRKGDLVSNKPVDVKMSNGTINANGLEVVDSGQLIRFTGGVIMNVTTLDSGGASTASAATR